MDLEKIEIAKELIKKLEIAKNTIETIDWLEEIQSIEFVGKSRSFKININNKKEYETYIIAITTDIKKYFDTRIKLIEQKILEL